MNPKIRAAIGCVMFPLNKAALCSAYTALCGRSLTGCRARRQTPALSGMPDGFPKGFFLISLQQFGKGATPVTSSSLLLYLGMCSVICVQIHLLNFAHQRIPRIGSRTLVIECLLRHLIQTVKEILLIHSIILNRFFDADNFL